MQVRRFCGRVAALVAIALILTVFVFPISRQRS